MVETGFACVQSRTRALAPLALVLAWTVAAAACRQADDAPTSTATTAPNAAPATEDPRTPKKVTKKDCETWGEHGAAAFVASVVFASEACPPEARDAVRKKFQDEIVTIRGAATNLCMGHVDETYKAGDAACFMKATDALTLRACKLGPMTSPDDTDWGSVLKSIHDKCGLAAPPGPGASAAAGAPGPGGAPSKAP